LTTWLLQVAVVAAVLQASVQAAAVLEATENLILSYLLHLRTFQ